MIIFKGFSFAKSCLGPESAPLRKGLHGSTQIVLCMGRGHRIMPVICKVSVFRKFYFYEPFYFVKIILRGFVFAEIGLSDIFLYVNLVSMK